MRKRLLTFATVVLGAVVGAWPTAQCHIQKCQASAADRATLAKFAEVQEGMTLEEVEALMGKPYDGQCWSSSSWPVSEKGRGIKGWTGAGTITVDVVLDDDGRVIGKRYHPNGPGPWDAAWAGLRWQLGW